jgi:hypothetical protein
MTRFARRFVLFQAFLLWQGGFLFYAAVVVPLGTEVLNSAFAQGLVTQQVTNALNLIGLAWHLAFAWDVLAADDPSRRRRWWRAGLGGGSLLVLVALALVHRRMDTLLVDQVIVGDDGFPPFRRWHITYLWLSTAHWVLGLATAALTLAAWHAESARVARTAP